jgi:hypothetical protein
MTATPDIQINSSLIDTGTINNNGAGSNIFGSNKGFAVDFGASYRVTNKLTVSASVIDLGFINWNSNVSNYQSDPNKTSFTFSGFDAVKFFNGSSIKPYLDTLSDSLKHTFYPNKTNNSYKTSLSTKVFAGANYTLVKGLDAGILLYGRFLDGQLYSGLALSLNEELGKILNVSASFSQINKTSNFGLGLSLNLLPIQIYLASDNIFAFTKVDDVRSTNVHFGLNVAIGRVKSN